jgi:hypothetical protein
MSNDKNNNLPLTHADGTVNCDNPKVCAAMIDGMGVILTGVMRDLKANTELLELMSDQTKSDLDAVFKTLQLVRNAQGIGTDWHGENLAYMVADIYLDSDKKRKAFGHALAAKMIEAGVPLDLLPPEFRPKPDAATTADALLDQLRADGVIG